MVIASDNEYGTDDGEASESSPSETYSDGSEDDKLNLKSAHKCHVPKTFKHAGPQPAKKQCLAQGDVNNIDSSSMFSSSASTPALKSLFLGKQAVRLLPSKPGAVTPPLDWAVMDDMTRRGGGKRSLKKTCEDASVLNLKNIIAVSCQCTCYIQLLTPTLFRQGPEQC